MLLLGKLSALLLLILNLACLELDTGSYRIKNDVLALRQTGQNFNVAFAQALTEAQLAQNERALIVLDIDRGDFPATNHRRRRHRHAHDATQHEVDPGKHSGNDA